MERTKSEQQAKQCDRIAEPGARKTTMDTLRSDWFVVVWIGHRDWEGNDGLHPSSAVYSFTQREDNLISGCFASTWNYLGTSQIIRVINRTENRFVQES